MPSHELDNVLDKATPSEKEQAVNFLVSKSPESKEKTLLANAIAHKYAEILNFDNIVKEYHLYLKKAEERLEALRPDISSDAKKRQEFEKIQQFRDKLQTELQNRPETRKTLVTEYRDLLAGTDFLKGLKEVRIKEVNKFIQDLKHEGINLKKEDETLLKSIPSHQEIQLQNHGADVPVLGLETKEQKQVMEAKEEVSQTLALMRISKSHGSNSSLDEIDSIADLYFSYLKTRKAAVETITKQLLNAPTVKELQKIAKELNENTQRSNNLLSEASTIFGPLKEEKLHSPATVSPFSTKLQPGNGGHHK